MDTFRCEPFGTITIRRRSGARNIRIRIEADGLSVSADYYTGEKEILKLIEDNRDKILAKQNELKSKRRLIAEDFKISNSYFSFTICKDDAIKKHLFLLKAESNAAPYKFVMRCNSHADFSSNEVQEKMLAAINLMIRNIAKGPLVERALRIANDLGFEVNTVRVKLEKTKWGSCSSQKNINLSAYLILLPSRLTDFVIIHELCHLKEMNHSRRFHELVNRYTGGNEAELEKELKRYSINIFDYTEQTDI